MPHRIVKDYALIDSPPKSSGGMADVYKASNLKNGNHVAMKIFKHGQIEDNILAESFRRETNALRELKHPSIVKLFDSGCDQETGEYFIVLEWMENDLASILQQSPIQNWQEYWEKIGNPILQALAFSHERQYIHRDVKPSNILVNQEGIVKLADFGISKLRKFFRPTVTLREFVSRPFTPPEEDDGSYPYTRDVFSFGVLTLKCLTSVNLVDYNSISRAIAELDAPVEFIQIIKKAVNNDPAIRQHNAEVLLLELENFYSKTYRNIVNERNVCFLKIAPNCLERIKRELNESFDRTIQEIILDDLNGELGCSIESSNNMDDEGHYTIYGNDYQYHVKVDYHSQSYFILLNFWKKSYSRLEQLRKIAFTVPYKFQFLNTSSNLFKGIQVINELSNSVIDNERKYNDKKNKERIFEVWWNILKAKADWEKQRETPIKYKSYELNGNNIIFELIDLPEGDITGQPRCINNNKNISILEGDVVEIVGDKLTLYVRRGEYDPPHKGELLFDTRLAEIAINRQKSAIDAIRYDRAVRTDLRELLVNPLSIERTESDISIDFIQSLNESQKRVVKAALTNNDFLLVQGPPGTGKTTFITELILQTLQQEPNARILLSSQTHVALDNALEKLQKENSDLKMIRIGNHESVSENVHSLLLEQQMEKWREFAINKSQDFLQKYSAQIGVSYQDLEVAILFRELKNIVLKLELFRKELADYQQEMEKKNSESDNQKKGKKQQKQKIINDNTEEYVISLQKKIKSIKDKRQQKVKSLVEKIPNIQSNDLVKLTSQQLEEIFSLSVIKPENPKVQQLQKLINLKTEWFEQFGRNSRFNEPLIKRSQVVAGTCIGIAREISDIEFDLCIIDEASKATATEVLVPMARSKKWILVGDHKQLPPFQDEVSQNSQFLEKYDLSKDDVKLTLFDQLRESLPESSCQNLTIQHRMIEPIGKLISHCFYDGNLQNQGPEIDRNLAEVLKMPVTWLTTSKLRNSGEQKQGSSFNNSCEVQIVVNLLKKINQVAKKFNKHYDLAVLSGYASQLRLLDRNINKEKGSLNTLNIECNTVDAFQGREADIVIYSVVRSNKNNEIGFLKNEARLNVALSRGRIGLVIVGDHQFCRSIKSSPLSRVLEYIDQHEEDCILSEATE